MPSPRRTAGPLAVAALLMLVSDREGHASGVDEDMLDFTAVHRAMLRQMVVVWDPTEVGAPTIDPAAPYGSTNAWKDVARIAGQNGLKVSNQEAPALHRQMLAALAVLLEHGELKPDRYTLPDPLHGRRSPFAGISLIDAAESAITGGLNVHPPHERGRTIALEFSAEHRRLLSALAVEWNDWSEEDEDWISGPGVDPKRPYGTARFYFLDVAQVLGMKPARSATKDDPGFSHQQLRQMGRLHHQMDLALQVFLRRAEVPLGRYSKQYGKCAKGYAWCR